MRPQKPALASLALFAAVLAGTLATLAARPAAAAESVGAQYEKLTEMEGTVVDVLCELSGSCPKNCGDGKRLLGIKAENGDITPVAKGAPIFANATPSVLPFCGKTIYADGLLIENPKLRLYYVQRYRADKTAEWKDDDGFDVQWAAKNGKSDEWYRNDPIVKATIGDKGVLGIKGLTPKPQ